MDKKELYNFFDIKNKKEGKALIKGWMGSKENKTQAQGKVIRKQSYPNDPPGYSKMVRRLEGEGATTSDAQAVADAHFKNYGKKYHESYKEKNSRKFWGS